MKRKIIIVGAPKLISATVNGLHAQIDRGEVKIVECTSTEGLFPDPIPYKARPELPELIQCNTIKADEKRISQQGWKGRDKWRR